MYLILLNKIKKHKLYENYNNFIPKIIFYDIFFTFRGYLMGLTKNQIGRYSRHLIMPEVGVKGQEKLAESKVLCLSLIHI